MRMLKLERSGCAAGANTRHVQSAPSRQIDLDIITNDDNVSCQSRMSVY